MSKKAKPIVINLDKLDSTEVRSENELIFQEEFVYLVRAIRRKAEENEQKLRTRANYSSREREKDDETRGVPTCFFIDGSRGSGKSTLMRSVKEELTRENRDAKEDSSIKLYPLADVDPTELGSGENFFLYLLGRIYKIIEKHYDIHGDDDAEVDKVRHAMEDLRKMSGGLQVLMDSDGALKKSGTPEFFLEECIDKCADSMSLRKKLCELLDKVAASTRKEIFLVTIDDADLNFSKCEDVLEYVRKYMQSPRLIFLFAGDMQLYSHVVRGMHINNFSGKQLRHDTSHAEHRHQMVDRLEEQYLLKLFPVDHRVQTNGLQKILKENRELRFKRYEGDEELSWRRYIYRYFVTGMPIEEESVITGILQRMPMRSVLFFLRYLGKSEYIENATASLKYILDGMQEVFLPFLVKKNVDCLQLGDANTELLLKSLFRYCAGSQLWHADLSMASPGDENGDKQVSLYLSVVVARSTRTLSSKLSYWCACFPAWQAVRDLYLQTYETRRVRDLVENCLKHETERGNSMWANLACAAIAPDTSSSFLFGTGMIGIFNEDRKQDDEKGWEYRRGIKSLFREFSELERKSLQEASKTVQQYVWALNFCLCCVEDDKGSCYYLSIYHLLSTIADWLDFGVEIWSRKEEELRERHADASYNTLHEHLKLAVRKKLSASYVIPNVARLLRGETTTASHSAVERLYHVNAGITDEDIETNMVSWLEKYMNVSYVTSAMDYSSSWKIFMAKCKKLTSLYIIEYTEYNLCPKAGSILMQYMRATEAAFENIYGGDNRLIDCIKAFPIWRILKNVDDNSEMLKLLNTAYIGDVINLKQKEDFFRRKESYQRLLRVVDEVKVRQTAMASKYGAVYDIWKKLLQERDAASDERTLRSEKIKELAAAEEALQHEIEACLAEESSARQSAQNAQEAELKERFKHAQQKCQIIDEIIKRDLYDYRLDAYFDKEMERTQGLLERAKTDATRQKHEMTLEIIQEVRSMLDQMDSDSKKEACRKIEEEWNFARNEYQKIVKEKQRLKIQEESTKNSRLQKEKKLAIMISRNEPFRKQAAEANIAYEIAVLKCRRMGEAVHDLEQEMAALKKEFEDALAQYEAAKKEYEAKKVDMNV